MPDVLTTIIFLLPVTNVFPDSSTGELPFLRSFPDCLVQHVFLKLNVSIQNF